MAASPTARRAWLLVAAGFGVGLLVSWTARPRATPRFRRSASGQSLRVAGDSIVLGTTNEGTGLWLQGPRGDSLQLGVHANGYPYVLVADAKVRTFGLGRVEGRQASPILVFRHDEEVKLVFGLDLGKPEREPFLVHWGRDGRKNLTLGEYCDAAGRVCAQ